jgi:hypothetical protein
MEIFRNITLFMCLCVISVVCLRLGITKLDTVLINLGIVFFRLSIM